MRGRYVLAPEAALDLVQIWRHIKNESNAEVADRVELVIRDRIVFLAKISNAGHARKDLTDQAGEILSSLFLPDRLSTRDETFAGGLDPSRS